MGVLPLCATCATACFLSPLARPPRPRHSLRRVHRAPAEAARRVLTAGAGSLVVALASAALILGDAGGASAFVTATPRKLHADEVATVTVCFFKDNTPSVVYITNLAIRQDAFTLDVLDVPQGSGSGFFWDKLGHIVTNFHVIRDASDLRAFGDALSVKGDVPVEDEVEASLISR